MNGNPHESTSPRGAITLDAANHAATVDLRTLPVIASGPAFQSVEKVAIDLRPAK